MPRQAVVRVSWLCSTFARTYNYTLLFSLVRLRFIRPLRFAEYRVWYAVSAPGKYLRLHSYGYNLDTEQYIEATLIRLREDGRASVLRQAGWYVAADTQDWPGCPRLIADFARARPPRHGYPRISFRKVYSQGDVEEALRGGECR